LEAGKRGKELPKKANATKGAVLVGVTIHKKKIEKAGKNFARRELLKRWRYPGKEKNKTVKGPSITEGKKQQSDLVRVGVFWGKEETT